MAAGRRRKGTVKTVKNFIFDDFGGRLLVFGKNENLCLADWLLFLFGCL